MRNWVKQKKLAIEDDNKSLLAATEIHDLISREVWCILNLVNIFF
jgi:hypothetical protein